MALSALDFHSRILGDDEIAGLLGTEADIKSMLAFEAALAAAEAEQGLINKDAADTIHRTIQAFEPDVGKLADSTLKDGVPVPELVRQLREAVGPEHDRFVHFGATSQDVVDTALALKLKPVFELFEQRLAAFDHIFAELIERFGKQPLMAHTRMQAAIPISASDRITVWRHLVGRAAGDIERVRNDMLILSLAGAAGTAEKFGNAIGPVREAMAKQLGLSVPEYVPHADRGRIAELAGWLSQVTGAFGKIGQDAALMAQSGQISIGGGGGSSAMPHKQNPVRAEVLVALARYNAVQVSALHQSLVHEQERSGSAWTLEWLTLPGMLEAAGISLQHAQSMLTAIERVGTGH